jgi:hypothetical protein
VSGGESRRGVGRSVHCHGDRGWCSIPTPCEFLVPTPGSHRVLQTTLLNLHQGPFGKVETGQLALLPETGWGK